MSAFGERRMLLRGGVASRKGETFDRVATKGNLVNRGCENVQQKRSPDVKEELARREGDIVKGKLNSGVVERGG